MMLPWIQSQDCRAEILSGLWCPLVVNVHQMLSCPCWETVWFTAVNYTELFLQALLTKIWWGAMTTDTAISKLVVSFFCPPLIWTNLIKFRWSHSPFIWALWIYVCVVCTDTLCVFLSDEELDNRNGREQFVELDSLDTEKALLLTDDDDPLWVCNERILKTIWDVWHNLLFSSFLIKNIAWFTLQCIPTVKLYLKHKSQMHHSHSCFHLNFIVPNKLEFVLQPYETQDTHT